MKKLLTAIILSVATVGSIAARDNEDSRLTIGGYGEATYTRMFYSNNYKRYTNANLYALPLHSRRFDAEANPLALNIYLTAAFVTVMVTYFGVNYLLGGLHSYA